MNALLKLLIAESMHIIKILVCLIVVLISGSCNKQLDLPPDGRITMDEVFSDYNRTRGYLNSCYGHAPAPGAARASLSDEAHDSEDVVMPLQHLERVHVH